MIASAVRIDPATRRRALGLGYVQGALWSIGNGLTTGALVTYLAIDLGAKGLGLSLILAAPALVGLLRICTPPLMARLGTAKRAAITFTLASYLLIWALPAAGLDFASPQVRLGLLIVLVSLHQLLEYMGQVAIWSWFADLVPPRLRGRYFGRRQMVQLAVLIPTLLASGQFADWWRSRFESSAGNRLLWGYSIPNAIGAIFLMLSLVPLARMPATGKMVTPGGQPLRQMLVALADSRFRRLLWYGCWLSFFNGITQAPQNFFPKQVLKLGIRYQAGLRIAMQFGQIIWSGWAGRFSDSYGNRPVLVVSQCALAAAPVFFLLATPDEPHWLAGAWVCWSAYAGLNICLPNLMLKLAGRLEVASYIASYFGITSVFYAASTIAGGYFFDWLSGLPKSSGLGGWKLDAFATTFWMALAARSVAILLALRLSEPDAWTWRDVLRARRQAE